MARGKSDKKNKWFGRTIFFCLLAGPSSRSSASPRESERGTASWRGSFPTSSGRRRSSASARPTGLRPTSTCFKPPVWGVGWALNVGRVVELIRRERGETAPIAA